MYERTKEEAPNNAHHLVPGDETLEKRPSDRPAYIILSIIAVVFFGGLITAWLTTPEGEITFNHVPVVTQPLATGEVK